MMAITFLEAWRKRAQVRVVNDSVLPWLLVTATNVASNINRSARRYRALLDRLPKSEWVGDPLSESDDAEAVAALARLSRADRRVVVLCVLEGFSEREAAEALGVPQGTVKSRLSRAKQRLRNQISDPSANRPLTEEVGQ
ncbi:MAG: RNA polymerase sigma factor [Rhodoglobus sp.]